MDSNEIMERAESLNLDYIRCVLGTWVISMEEMEDSGEKIKKCPHCGGVVEKIRATDFWKEKVQFQLGNYAWPTWKKTTQDATWKPKEHPGYIEMWQWAAQQGRCYSHIAHLKNSYKKHAGITVDIEP